MKTFLLLSLLVGSVQAADFKISCKKVPGGEQGASVGTASGKLKISAHPTMPKYKIIKGKLKVSLSKGAVSVLATKEYTVSGMMYKKNVNGVKYTFAGVAPAQPNKLQSVSIIKGPDALSTVLFDGGSYMMNCK